MEFACIYKVLKRQNICRFFHIFLPIPFTVSKIKPDCYHQKVNAKAAEQLKELRRILGIPKMPGIDREYPVGHQKKESFTNCQKTEKAVKHSKKKLILLNFVNLSAIFCPRLSAETCFHFWLGQSLLEIVFSVDFRILRDSLALNISIYSKWVTIMN